MPPAERAGQLWQLYASLQRGEVPGMEGAKLDATSYTTAFRMQLVRPEQAGALAPALPPGLATASNLGMADVFAATSGKDKAAAHLMRRWGVQPDDCVFMCGAWGLEAGMCWPSPVCTAAGRRQRCPPG